MEVVSYNRYAGFFRRFIAFLIDSIITRIGLTILFFHSADFEMYDIHNLFSRHTIVVELILMAYFVFCESSVWQATLGKKLLNIKVVDESFSRISPGTALIRYLFKYLSTFVFLLGYIWIIFDSKKQGWHDKLAKTFVIEA